MLDALILESETDQSTGADMFREMAETAGRQIANIYGDLDMKSTEDRTRFLMILDYFTVLMWQATVPLMHDDCPEDIQKTFDRFIDSTKKRFRLRQNRIDVLALYARESRTVN